MRKLNVIIGLLLSIIFLYLTIRNVAMEKVMIILAKVDFYQLLFCILLFLVMLFLRSERWRLLLHPMDFGIKDTFQVFTIGAGSLLVLPARLGEFVRPILMGRRGVSRSAVFATVIFERVFDGITQILLFVTLLFLMDFDPWVQRGGYLATLLYTTAIIFLILVHTRQKFLLRVTEKLFSRFPKFTQFMQKTITGFSGGLHSLRDVKRLVLAFIYSILAWALSIYYIVLIFDSLHVTFENPLLVAAFVQLVVSLGTILPAAPGQIGTFHYFCVISLTWFNLPREEAFSLAILYHALSLLLLVIPGLVAIFLEGTINFKDLLDPNLPTPETKICEVLEK